MYLHRTRRTLITTQRLAQVLLGGAFWCQPRAALLTHIAMVLQVGGVTSQRARMSALEQPTTTWQMTSAFAHVQLEILRFADVNDIRGVVVTSKRHHRTDLS